MSSQLSSPRAVLGTALHTPVRGKLETLRETLIIIGDNGRIEALMPRGAADFAAAAARFSAEGSLVTLRNDEFLMPGMVDLHVHAPQWPQLGLALELPLEEWLNVHTFPLEARYADLEFARSQYELLVDGLLANGTTTTLYFGTIHLPATQCLADICLRRGQRALIGRVAMDNPRECPDFYRDESAAQAEADTRSFIAYVKSMSGNENARIKPVITPRFIPSCSDELLHRLGALAAETGVHVQTHCSESDWEHGYVLERCGVSDTTALANFGLLSRHTILAHGNLIGERDAAQIVAAGAGVAHCPLSNVYFSDAVFPLRRMLDRGVHVGLGTDIAGGASPSIVENARQAVIMSRTLESGVDPNLPRDQRRGPSSRIDALTALWLGTAGGGVALDEPVGLFRVGYHFDAIVVDACANGSNLRVDANDAAEDIVQKIIYGAGRSNIAAVWVGGRLVHGAAHPARGL